MVGGKWHLELPTIRFRQMPRGKTPKNAPIIDEGIPKYTNEVKSRDILLKEITMEWFYLGKMPIESLKLLEVDEKLKSVEQRLYRQQTKGKPDKEFPEKFIKIVNEGRKKIEELAAGRSITAGAHPTVLRKNRAFPPGQKFNEQEFVVHILQLEKPSVYKEYDRGTDFSHEPKWPFAIGVHFKAITKLPKSEVDQLKSEITAFEDAATVEGVIKKAPPPEERAGVGTGDGVENNNKMNRNKESKGAETKITTISATKLLPQVVRDEEPLQRTETSSKFEDETENLPSESNISSSLLESVVTGSGATKISEDADTNTGQSPKTISLTVVSGDSPIDETAREDLHVQRGEIESEPEIVSESIFVPTESHFTHIDSAAIVPEITEEDDQNGHSPTTKSAGIISGYSPKKLKVTSPLHHSSVEIVGGKEIASPMRIGTAATSDSGTKPWISALVEFISIIGDYDSTLIASQTLMSHHQKLKDWLRNDRSRARDIFGFLLYCLLYAYDVKLSMSKLVRYCIQDGLITGSAFDANKKWEEMVEVLIDAALLERHDGGVLVKIPDASRDFAVKMLLSVLSDIDFFVGTGSGALLKPESRSLSWNLDQFLTKTGGGTKKPVPINEWENAKMIFMMDNEFVHLPESPNCSNLLIMFLQRNHQLRALPKYFFHHMHSLRILDVSETDITSLPSSISCLVSLLRLIAKDCKRLTRLPPDVGELKHIESLEAGGSYIFELPPQTEKLRLLKCLEVSLFGPVDPREYAMLPSELIYPRIISKLKSLTTLRIWVHPGDKRWIENINSVIADICELENLTSLCLHFPKIKNLKDFLAKSPSWKGVCLTKFNFIVGHDVKRMISRVPQNLEFEYNQQDRCLRYVNGNMIPEAVRKVLRRATAFCLDHHMKILSLSEFNSECIKSIKFCIVRECPEMETIIDSGEDLTFAKLEHLSIHYLPSCESIWRGRLSNESFASLKRLQLQACPKLKILVTSSMCESITKLEELVVESCAAMEELISDDNYMKAGGVLLPNLKTLTLRYLPKLVRIFQGSWPCLKRLNFYHVPNLKNLKMGSNFELTRSVEIIEAETKWWHDLEWDDNFLYNEMETRFKPSPEEVKFVGK